MARKPEEITDPQDLATYYLATAEFPSGFMTQYGASAVVASDRHQDLATGYPIGKRFASVEVARVSDGNVVHLGHHARADGRWRIYAFADSAEAGQPSALSQWADWMAGPQSPVTVHTPAGADPDAVFDVKAIYQQRYDEIEFPAVPEVFRPRSGPLGLTDWEKVFGAAPSAWHDSDIFDERGLSRDGVVVVVRPDQYVAGVFPLAATDELAAFFAGALRTVSSAGRPAY